MKILAKVGYWLFLLGSGFMLSYFSMLDIVFGIGFLLFILGLGWMMIFIIDTLGKK